MVRDACIRAGVTEAQVREACNEMGISVAQYLGLDDTPKCELAYKYVLGKPLVRPEEVHHLPTRMRHLHQWYMDITKGGNANWLTVDVRDEHYFRPSTMHIEMSELFQLFNQDAIDKVIISCYCL